MNLQEVSNEYIVRDDWETISASTCIALIY